MIKKVENTKQVEHIFNNCEDTICWRGKRRTSFI